MSLNVYYLISVLIYVLFLSSLLLISIKINQRMWLHRYPKEVKTKVSGKTNIEKRQFLMFGIPFIIFTFGYPIVSALYMIDNYDINSYWIVAFYFFILFVSFNIIDTFFIDLILFTILTVDFIMIDKTEKEDYKDFNYHLKSGLKGLVYTIPISFFLALLIY